ncbi:ATP-binding protein [Methylicorpusculum sp.]|uniref:hybrid sensor histidine kinase/response regulator n=3 Tax=Methylicorpusculum sp. TaxID=2713644 RepID=UPI00272FABB3|nr:ATP-binding protein [Methylicorpusculum sp.]MDP2178717.1 ATP-binding protein [Methylicorpusculum sp.]MDP3531649.1 ATP-binding protein [Methylicorpusculum sp.]
MNAQQKVFRVRRNYNRWVANQTLEDYALRFTANSARKWSAMQVALTALGAISFLALEAIGGAITLSYGFTNAVTAVAVVGTIIFLTGLPICYHAAKQGIDIDLLTRGAGFGYIGSTITSLIYASFTFIFFALEAAILSLALELILNIPLSIGYLISALLVIPLVTHGITLISRFQIWTQPLWIVLQILPLACIALKSDEAISLWTGYNPTATGPDFNLIAFGAASAVLFSLIAQIGEQVDFLRFLPQKNKSSRSWWLAMLTAGPGWIIIGSGKILIGSFLAVLALKHGIADDEASDPNRMYLTAFSYMNQSPQFTLLLTGVFVILSQLKINVTNAYAGSIAWSNFFSRLTQNHPGRVVWLVFNVAIALMLMELGIYRVLKEILGVYAIIALAWVGSMVADLVINKPLGLRPQTMEFKRAHLYDINPVGVGSMFVASVTGFMAHAGLFGDIPRALSSFIALGSTFVCAPLIAWLTQGRYYIAREPTVFPSRAEISCCICEHHFEPEDMSHCPAYAGPICSLCCSLDSRCHDMCKTNARLSDQLTATLSLVFPLSWVKVLNTRMGHFLGLFILTSLMIASLLTLVYFQITLDDGVEKKVVARALINVFFILLIVSGVVAWMFALVHENRKIAQEESRRQTQLLMAEITAHKKTDQELQQAKEVAESANKAKSRYLTGISHELRSPLNAIMGYAQLLEKDPAIPAKRRDALAVIRRSSEHLADLIEGLLDISRIEAGRLHLSRSDVQLGSLLDQIVSMFEVQAMSKGIHFDYTCLTPLPDTVRTDEKRLRQILINVISNAIKYTHQGQVSLSVSYRNQVAEFSIKDTGVGIAPKDLDRIFRPFERIRKAGSPHITGTGLGLTITRFLTEIMGGDISVESTPGVGSHFNVRLMLSSALTLAANTAPEKIVCGYAGKEQTVFVVDDEPSHRGLLQEMLTPLGFNVIQAQDGLSCLDMLQYCECEPHIFLLDIAMPGISGWELAHIVRKRIPSAIILMVSANANEQVPQQLQMAPHNAYLVKPLRMAQLLDTLQQQTGLTWLYKSCEQDTQNQANVTLAATQINKGISDTLKTHLITDQEARGELIRLAQIGYANGICSLLEQLKNEHQIDADLMQQLEELTHQFQFSALIKLLKEQA